MNFYEGYSYVCMYIYSTSLQYPLSQDSFNVS